MKQERTARGGVITSAERVDTKKEKPFVQRLLEKGGNPAPKSTSDDPFVQRLVREQNEREAQRQRNVKDALERYDKAKNSFAERLVREQNERERATGRAIWFV